MKLMTMKQYMKMSKPALIRKITQTLRAMPKKRLAMVCYNITKSKLPRFGSDIRTFERPLKTGLGTETFAYRTIKRKALPKRKKKRKFSRKQLAAQRLFAKRARAGTLRR